MPSEEQLEALRTQLWNAGIIGSLRGTLVGLVSGLYLNYKYNKGPNVRFFSTPYKFLYLISWNVAGIIFTTDIAKTKLRHQIAIEDEIKRDTYLQQELAQARR
ncbi:hypothetical protein JA9_001043 [Meyerozyma sp. JA9]|nr:hypothetical protein JA9_001043 [Meyerozyma sp. JA9]